MKNNTIALLIGVLIVISVASILAGPKQITRFSGVTGHATGDSYVLFNMSSEVSVMVTGAINFGSGKVNESASFAVLDSDIGSYDFSFEDITSTAGTPPPTNLLGMTTAFDSKRNVTVEYGAILTMWPDWTRLNQTWEFNHNDKNWSLITSADPNPANRSNVALVYDSSADRVILFGGDSISGVLNDTWEYNSTSWTELSPSTAPPARQKAAVVFDSVRNVTVLYGGSPEGGLGGQRMGDMWEYNYSSNTWTNISTASSPGELSISDGLSMVFDKKEGKVLLSNGSAIWEYDGTDWTVRVADISASSGISSSYQNGLLGYDDSRNVTLLGSAYLGDRLYYNFWEYDYSKNSFARIYDANSPNYFPSTGSYDSNHHELMMFYVIDVSNTLGINKTWILNYTTSAFAQNGSWVFYKDYFSVENDGTVNVSVNYTADNAASAFIGGTSPSFMLKGVVEQLGACDNLATTYTEVSSSGEKEVCDVLHYPISNDTFRVAVKLVVPSDVNSGAHNTTITFTGREV